MKKLTIALVAIFILALAASSCKSTKKCAAYGEHYRYQKEIKY